MQQVVIPGGKEKGKPVSQASVGTLEYWASAGRDESVRDACANELRERSSGGQRSRSGEQSQQSSGRSAPLPKGEGLLFKSDDPASVTAWFHEHRDEFHFVTPATVVQSLPEGFEVAISTIYVNPCLPPGQKSNGDVYETEGSGLGLGATVLAKISAGAGINWDTRQSGQIGDHSHPHFVKHQVVGGYRLFDGTAIVDVATKTLDLRDGSARVEGKTPKWITAQRENIHEMAETKAKNRFIRRLGLKSSYSFSELDGRPFAVARLMFTGRSKDPELRRAFALLNAQRMLGGMGALFGESERSPLELGSASFAQPIRELTSGREDNEDSSPGVAIPSPRRPSKREEEQRPPAAEPAQAARATEQNAGEARQGSLVGDGYDDRGDDPNKY